MAVFDKIFEFANTIKIVDTHEHLFSTEAKWLAHGNGKWDVLQEYLFHYFCWDLVSAGLPMTDLEKVRWTDTPIVEKWDLIKKYWKFAQHTGYARALNIAAKKRYQISSINGDTIEELNNAFQIQRVPGAYKKVLNDLSNIKTGLLDSIKAYDDNDLDCDHEFFKPVFNTVSLVVPESSQHIFDLELKTNIRITSFNAYLESCTVMLERALLKGAVALKSDIAYKRSLLFERATKAIAEEEFNQFLGSLLRDGGRDGKNMFLGENAQNYIMHYILELANKKQLVYQIHTGYLEGAGNYLNWADPTHLTNLFIQYSDVKFAVFHIGYPFHHKISALAKNFHNVFIDMCWVHILSPVACVNALAEWLETVPYNKICGFGGDTLILDAVYGHRVMALENISQALAKKIDQGKFNLDEAKNIIRHILHDNAVNLYQLK